MTVSAAPLNSVLTAAKPPVKRRGSWLKQLALILVWQIAALLTVEGVLFWIGMGEEDIYKLDKTLGFTHFPNKRVTWRSEGFSQSWFDADGMRDPGLTIQKPAGVYRIALLGDSMVEGLQVPINETFGKLIEKRLNAKNKHSVQVLNFANSGYSTAQEYLELQTKVFKYHPDLVVLGYMSRDMFENWSPPDQTITNVRPYALHLPDKQLVVDSSPVLKWMRTPRAKFMMKIQWLRHHSRIWGLISATEMQLSLQDPTYKAVSAFLQNPGKSIWQGWKGVRQFVAHPPSLKEMTATLTAPSFNINFFEGNSKRSEHDRRAEMAQSSITHAPHTIPRVKFVVAPQLQVSDKTAGGQTGSQRADNETSGSSNRVASQTTASVQPIYVASRNQETINRDVSTNSSSVSIIEKDRKENGGASSTGKISSAETNKPAIEKNSNSAQNLEISQAQNGNATYVELMKRTMNSLIASMQDECTRHGCAFSVLVLPCRAQLSPTPGMETSFFNIKYSDEISIVSNICAQQHIPMFNAEAAAEMLPPAQRPEMFYLMHLNAKGQEFIANKLYPFIENAVEHHGQ